MVRQAPALSAEARGERATNRLLTAHGYTTEAMDTILTPMGAYGKVRRRRRRRRRYFVFQEGTMFKKGTV